MFSSRRARLNRLAYIFAACLLASTWLVLSPQAQALRLLQPSLEIGNSAPGATTSHTFTFGFATTTSPVGSIVIEYCTNALEELPCTPTPDLDASGATLASQTGAIGFSVLTAQTGRIVLTRAASLPPAGGLSEYVLNGITDPAGTPGTFYARIMTFGSTDGSGTEIDYGVGVSSTAQTVTVNTEVPPILKFCIGLTITGDCSTASGNIVDVGQLSTNAVSSGTSQMQAATNAQLGLSIAVYGTTMTSGNNSIAALSVPTPSAPGNAQFGLNLRKNSDPDLGDDPSGTGVSDPAASYNIPDKYMFENGSVVANSPVATDTRTFTSTYIVNVPPDQSPGVYTATLTYICTATF